MARTSWTEADQQAFDDLADQLIQRAADLTDRFPLGGLTAAQRELLVSGFDLSEISGDALIQRWAQATGSRPDIRSIDPAHRSLSGFRRKGAANRRQRLAQEENALAVAEATMARRNRPSARGVPQEGPSPDEMINSGSAALIALGYLRRERADRLWKDDFRDHIRLDWDGGFDPAVIPAYPLDDAALGRIQTWLRCANPKEMGSVSDGVLESAIRNAADYDHRNEPLEWLEGLSWDKVERLPNMMHRIFKAPQTALNQAIGSNLLIGGVARIFKPGCKLDTMVVLRGGQGLNKSTACQILGGPWYAQTHAGIGSKDFLLDLKGRAVVELPELHSLLRTPSGAAKVKATLSSASDLFRSPYERLPRMHDRTATLIGTTNDRAFHSDPTGGRRFMVVDTPQLIDIATLRAERDQLFAEAVARYKAGATWWEFPEDEHREMIESASAVNYLQERLEERLQNEDIYDGVSRLEEEIVDGVRRPALAPIAPSLETVGDQDVPVQWGTLLTTHRCAHWLGLSPKDAETGQIRNRLTEALRGMGFELYRLKVRSDRDNVRVWLRSKPEGLRVERAGLRGKEPGLSF